MNDSLLTPEAVIDPYEFFARLREVGPVYWSGSHRAWVITSYDAVKEGFNDARLRTVRPEDLKKQEQDGNMDASQASRMLANWMNFNDAPRHSHLRAPVRAAFSPKAVQRLTREAEAAIRDSMMGLKDSEQFDMVRDVAFPIPAAVIAILLGVPKERRDEFREWSRMLGALVMGKIARVDAWARALAATSQFHELFTELIQQYRDAPEENLMSDLIRDGEEGRHDLTIDELVATCTVLLFGGHETTTNLIASGVLALLRHPEQLERLRSDPDLLPLAVDEMLRYDGPSKVMVRHATEDFTWNGLDIHCNDSIFLGVAAANHDPVQFESPHMFDVTRTPNPHLSFGWGMHHCLGAQLARLEASLTFSAMLELIPDLELAVPVEQLDWHPTVVGRALKSLPVRVR